MLPVGTTLEQKHFPKATLTLIVANVLAFLVELLAPPVSLTWIGENLAFGPRNLSPVAFVASLFLHGDVYHIVGNMLYLWIFGAPVEDRVGSKRFALFYFGAGSVANVMFTVMEFARTDAPTSAAIGASGAVSGVMAIYLYRCFYSKLKMVVSPVFLPVNINIPAAPFILFWFFQDFFYGLVAMSRPTGVAHWAHVGGFIFGLTVSRLNRYGHEAAVEHYSDRLVEKLRSGDGWKSMADDRELLKLLKLSNGSPEVHQQLAQFYAAKGRTDEAKEHYHKAAGKYASTNQLYAAFVVLDHLRTLGRPMGLPHHLRAADALSAQGYVEDAYEVLVPVLTESAPAVLAERARLLHLKTCRSIGKDEEAGESLGQFRRLFPKSLRMREAEQALTRDPGSLFPAPQPAPETAPDASAADDEPENKALTIAACAGQLITDPLFIFLWLASTFFLSWFSWHHYMQIVIFLAALLMTAFIRVDWTHAWRELTVDEQQSRKEADYSTLTNRAALAERSENFPRAAELYEQVLGIAPSNIQVRFDLARIYLHRMQDHASAARHLRTLADTAPKGHPYRAFALEELKRFPGHRQHP